MIASICNKLYTVTKLHVHTHTLRVHTHTHVHTLQYTHIVFENLTCTQYLNHAHFRAISAFKEHDISPYT